MKTVISAACLAVLLTGCGIEDVVRKNDDRYAKPGAMDPVIADIFYRTYQFKLLDKYLITHQWVNTSGCSYRAAMKPGATPRELTFFYIGQDVVEQDGKTWQRFASGKLIDFDSWVRSVTVISKAKGREGQPYEAGLQPMCFESWWGSSHYLRLRLQRKTLSELEEALEQRYPEGQWRSELRNQLHWRVQQVPSDKFRSPPLNGLGGPYQAWLVALGDSGYSMAIEMGASTESLKHPQAHAALENVYMHLIDSLKVERLQP